jgi:hypothetical protein
VIVPLFTFVAAIEFFSGFSRFQISMLKAPYSESNAKAAMAPRTAMMMIPI